MVSDGKRLTSIAICRPPPGNTSGQGLSRHDHSKEFGGLLFVLRTQVITKLSTHSSTVAVTVMVPNSLGPGELLLHYGTDEQKNHFLPRLAKGIEIPCFALTNPNAGSDAAAIPDFGIVCMGEHQGKSTLGLKLTWEKRYITLGPVATILGLAFRAYDPDHLLGDKEDLGITCALIPTHHPGVSIGRRHMPLNAVFTGPNCKDVFIPSNGSLAARRKLVTAADAVECSPPARHLAAPSSTGMAKLAVRAIGPMPAFAPVQDADGRVRIWRKRRAHGAICT